MAETAARTAAEADFIFRIGEGDSEQLRVTGFSGTEGMGQLYEFQVDLTSDDANLDPKTFVSQAAVLEIRAPEGSRFVHGIVRRFARTGEGTHQSHYAASIVPVHWLLTHRHRSRIFQEHNCSDMTTPGIIKKVLADAGIPADSYRFALTGKYTAYEYVVQYRETEWDFISRWMEHEGIYTYYEHTADGYKLVFADAKDGHVVTPVTSDFVYREATGLVSEAEQEFVFQVLDSEEIQFGTAALDDFNFMTPGDDLLVSQEDKQYTALEFSDYPGGFLDKDAGKPFAKIRLEEFVCRRRTQSMRACIRVLLPGFKFALSEHPSEAVNREYLVTRVSHYGLQPQSGREETESSRGIEYECNIETIPSDVQYRSPRVTPRPIVRGTQTAIVVGPSDEEIYTDKWGRVKVQFAWDREGKYDENSSRWIRVSHGQAGGQYGMFFLPRIGQEVIVDYLEGNPDHPIIVGRVYNNDLMPPYPLPAEKTKSTIKGHSSKGGGGCNEIRFEDLKDKEQLLVQAQRQMDLRVKASHYHTVGSNYELHVGGEKDGELYGEYKQFIYKAKHTHVKGEVMSLVEEDVSEHVKGKTSVHVEGTHSVTVDGDVVEKYGTNQKTEVTATRELKADSIRLEATTCIELKCGGSSIHITPGTIYIQGGPMVNINSGAGPAVSAVSAGATAPTEAKDAGGADKTDPGADVRYGGAPVPTPPVVPPKPAPPPKPSDEDDKKKTSFIEIRLVDEEDNPIPGEKYKITLPDGKEKEGTLDANGKAKVTGIDPGTCKITFPRLDLTTWQRK